MAPSSSSYNTPPLFQSKVPKSFTFFKKKPTWSGSSSHVLVPTFVAFLLLLQNTMTKAVYGGKSWFGLTVSWFSTSLVHQGSLALAGMVGRAWNLEFTGMNQREKTRRRAKLETPKAFLQQGNLLKSLNSTTNQGPSIQVQEQRGEHVSFNPWQMITLRLEKRQSSIGRCTSS